MDTLALVGGTARLSLDYGFISFEYFKKKAQRLLALTHLYGLTGLILGVFGSSNVWLAEARILGGMVDNQAMEFRKSVQDECNMIAIEVSTLFRPFILTPL